VPGEKRDRGTAFVAGELVALPESEAHHVARVLRLRVGDAVEIFDGCGGSARGRVARIGRHDVEVAAEEVCPLAARTGPAIHLAFAVPKGNRLDWLLEKTTELGVASLAPVVFERSVAGGDELSAAKRERWMGHCIAAAKQAGLDFLPTLSDPCRLPALVAAAEGTTGLYGDLAQGAVPLARAIEGIAASGGAVSIVVGPEGGLTDAERQTLRDGRFTAVRLGRTTLRIETAAVALVAAVIAVCDRGRF
jgi:16S rRNA (uracil1498-N3)-methyltransferase